jgi:hypothetical protein
VATYAGNFASDTGVNLEIVERGGELSLDVTVNGEPLPDGSGPLVMVERDRAVFEFAGVPFLTDFVRDDAGEVSWIRFSGRLSPRAD